MKVIRWPELDVLESSGKLIDQFWMQTEKGPISIGNLFAESEMEKLIDIKNRKEKAEKLVNDITSELYKVKRPGR